MFKIKTNKKKNIIKYILIIFIFIILIPYFLSGKGEYINNNQINKNHQNISLKKRRSNFFYKRKNYALIKSFFLKKTKSEYLFKKKDYKKA